MMLPCSYTDLCGSGGKFLLRMVIEKYPRVFVDVSVLTCRCC